MKHLFALSILLFVFSSSCISSQHIATQTAIPTKTLIPSPTSSPIKSLVESAQTVNILPERYIDRLISYHFVLSPNGEKIALKFPTFDKNQERSLVIPIHSINSNESINTFKVELDRDSTYYYIDSWAPDGTALVGGYYDASKFSGGEWCCGEAIAITNFSNGEAKTFTYAWGWNHSNQILWSNDSSMLSVTFYTDQYNTLIINRYGDLIKELKTGEKAAFWVDDVLFFTVLIGDRVELWSLDMTKQAPELVLHNFNGKSFVAYNQRLNEILLTETTLNMNDISLSERKYHIFNIDSKKIKELETPIPNTWWVYPVIPSYSQESIALDVSFRQDESLLWMFDWKTHKFKEYGEIKGLLGWINKLNGFLVISLSGEQKIIKP